MRKKREVIKNLISMALLVVVGCLCFFVVGEWTDTNVDDFYFEDFTGDYYLSRAENGASRLHVKEVLTAVFPDSDQNHGINRRIPFSNQGGLNLTIENYDSMNLTVLRNGEPEPMSKVETKNGYYDVYIGSEDKYVRGQQTYVLEYDFINVVTEFDENGKNTNGLGGGIFQELYWNTNGTGWKQKFNNVTARVHFDSDIYDGFTGETWCYVGKSGESGQDRCMTYGIGDGVAFTASDLKEHENLTFDVKIKAGSFVVPESLKRTYVGFYMAMVFVMVCALLAVLPFFTKFYKNAKKKKEFYKDLFVKPEYQPNPDYSVAEMAEVYIGKKKDKKAATILDMVVKKKISLISEDKNSRKKWKIKILDLDDVDSQERILLTILNGGVKPMVGDEISLRRQYKPELEKLGEKYNEMQENISKKLGLMEDGKKKVPVIAMLVIYVVVLMITMTIIFGVLDNYDVFSGYYIVGEGDPFFFFALTSAPFVSYAINTAILLHYEKYATRTKKGLEVSRYMDGLKLYIEMAEADRLKFLQSVKGVDMSNEGIVHLYEKLLPYAAVLGLEDSWIKELEKYYKMDGVLEPDWYRVGITVGDLCMASTSASMCIQGSSSSFSGSGGGFSGGGGGGGGGGGW